MVRHTSFGVACIAFVSLFLQSPAFAASQAKVSNAQTSITLLYQNNLNYTDDVNHGGALLLDAMSYSQALLACAALNEELLPVSQVNAQYNDLTSQLAYQIYAGHVKSHQFWLDEEKLLTLDGQHSYRLIAASKNSSRIYPVLCTQSAQYNDAGGFSDPPASATVTVAAGDVYQGFRTKKAFWFAGIRYATFPGRFRYSSVYKGNGTVVSATRNGPQCLQYGSGSEDCLFLNIETPYLPKSGEKLRPVLFWIHGGGFTGGQGAGNGGQFASREDIVTVTINYRLSTYGFLAVPGQLAGNYGLADQATALDWVIANIAKFGGDPKRITIAGQSAGAGSVRVMLGSPQSIGKFQGAVAMSNLGIDSALGKGVGYGTTYSAYFTIDQSYQVAGQNIFQQAGCNSTSLTEQVACLTSYPGDLSSFSNVARYPVQDGRIINTPQLRLDSKNPNTAHVPVIFGVAEDDGGSVGTYNKTCTSEVDCLASNIGISTENAQRVIDSGLFPLVDTGNLTADSVKVSIRVNTDLTWRCADVATVYAAAVSNAFSAAYYYESVRAYAEEAYNPLGVDITGAVSPEYPLGNPNTFYYKVHSSDLPNFFGSLHSFRDVNDLRTVQLTSGYFAAFIRTGQPNPDLGYLRIRGYNDTIRAINTAGSWSPVSQKSGPTKNLDYPSATGTFVDSAQCAFLNSSLTYYLDGGQ